MAPRRAAPRAPARDARACAADLDQAVALLREWRRRSYERAELAKLDDRMLRDIGVTPGEAWHEINKPFWRQ